MTRYRIKQTVFMLLGVLAGWYCGNAFMEYSMQKWMMMNPAEVAKFVPGSASMTSEQLVAEGRKVYRGTPYYYQSVGQFCVLPAIIGFFVGWYIAVLTGGGDDKKSG